MADNHDDFAETPDQYCLYCEEEGLAKPKQWSCKRHRWRSSTWFDPFRTGVER